MLHPLLLQLLLLACLSHPEPPAAAYELSLVASHSLHHTAFSITCSVQCTRSTWREGMTLCMIKGQGLIVSQTAAMQLKAHTGVKCCKLVKELCIECGRCRISELANACMSGLALETCCAACSRYTVCAGLIRQESCPVLLSSYVSKWREPTSRQNAASLNGLCFAECCGSGGLSHMSRFVFFAKLIPMLICNAMFDILCQVHATQVQDQAGAATLLVASHIIAILLNTTSMGPSVHPECTWSPWYVF